jgi:hypothetical protein
MANYILQWLEKSFQVSPDQILTYSGLNASHSFNTEEKKNGKDMPKTKEIGPAIGSMSFNVPLSMLQNNDVKTEYEWWRDECEKGTCSYIYIGGYKFGNYEWRLNRVDLSDLVTVNDGSVWKSCKLAIGFEEFYVKTRKTKAERKAARLLKKMRKALNKAQNAKNEKAQKKAANQAAKYQKLYDDQKVKVAQEKAERAERMSKADDFKQEFYKAYQDYNTLEKPEYKEMLRKFKEQQKLIKQGA